ncbi:unnamed protein product, partial [Heterosigma akashiwo]
AEAVDDEEEEEDDEEARPAAEAYRGTPVFIIDDSEVFEDFVTSVTTLHRAVAHKLLTAAAA